VLAPLLMIGGAMGALEGAFLPGEGAGFWALIAMAAILGGTMRSPLTGLAFALELTRDVASVPAILTAVLIAHAFTVLLMKRSILTEKVSRRGLHLGREYAVDPLELGFARDVMKTNVAAFPEEALHAGVAEALHKDEHRGRQRLYPVVDSRGALTGVLTASQLDVAIRDEASAWTALAEVVERNPVVAYADEPLRVVADRMAQSGRTVLPVLARDGAGTLVGLITPNELLLGRIRAFADEWRRERPLRVRFVTGRRVRAAP
jgi:CBS domain-containing protein